MQAAMSIAESNGYANCVEASRRIRWEIDRDVIKGRSFDFGRRFLPDGRSKAPTLDFVSPAEQRFISQIQGRTYANMLGLVERFIGAGTLEVSRDRWLGDQTASEARVRVADEVPKHQELFRRIEAMIAEGMPLGYRFVPQPSDLEQVVLGKSPWAVLGLTCLIERLTQQHYRASIEPDADLSPLWKDVLLFHWKEESQHAILDELEWRREDARLSPGERDAAVDDLIALAGAVDWILQTQAEADTHYFVEARNRPATSADAEKLRNALLTAYRWQHIVSGVQEPRFAAILGSLITPEQAARIGATLAPIVG